MYNPYEIMLLYFSQAVDYSKLMQMASQKSHVVLSILSQMQEHSSCVLA